MIRVLDRSYMKELCLAVAAVFVLTINTSAQQRGGDPNRMVERARQSGVTFNEAPTMRMSIFDVVERIGGARAEAILARQLEVTARGAEIVHLDGNLERIAGDKYREDVLAAVKAVLANPPELDTGMRVDERGTVALWGLLRKYEDNSFVDFAKTMLVDENGRLHRQAREYLQRHLKDDIMPVYQEIYANPNLNDGTRREIAIEAGRRMGENAAANAIVVARFTEAMNSLANPPEQPAEGEGRQRRGDPRADSIGKARYYLERLAQGRDLTAQSIAGRQALLASFRAATADAEVVTMMDKVGERLNTMAADPTKRLPGFSLRSQRQGGQRGGRPSNGKND